MISSIIKNKYVLLLDERDDDRAIVERLFLNTMHHMPRRSVKRKIGVVSYVVNTESSNDTDHAFGTMMKALGLIVVEPKMVILSDAVDKGFTVVRFAKSTADEITALYKALSEMRYCIYTKKITASVCLKTPTP